jgi:hypothetical protein
MSKIREDLIGVVNVGEYVLKAGDTVPEGAVVGDHVLASEEATEPVEPQPEAEAEPETPKRRPRTTKPKE